MDKAISSTQIHRKAKIAVFSIFFILFIGVISAAFALIKNNTKSILISETQLYDINSGSVTEYLNARAIAIPENSMVLTALQGGIVTEIFKERSDRVIKGEVIANLNNYDFVLDVTSKASFITEQIANLRNLKLALQSQKLEVNLDYNEARYNKDTISRELSKKKVISESGFIEENEIKNLTDKLNYWVSRYDLLSSFLNIEVKESDENVSSVDKSIIELHKLRNSITDGLSQLVILSPIDGVVSELNLKLGQKVGNGATIGLVDNDGKYHFESELSEYYLDKIFVGTPVSAIINGRTVNLNINKISNIVENGRFGFTLNFNNQEGLSLKRGQTINIEIAISTHEDSYTASADAFLRDNGKYYSYLYEPESNTAIKSEFTIRSIGNGVVEVLSGYKSGYKLLIPKNKSLISINMLEVS
ncbi:HlyD family efflux transporter periplasmic adaptor subunit [Photobacterium kasasachensis]|uniref:HlyD family efflux transporter periplasmic adaptor subunit n=1 Tax=Photobacterium kasasachensis TaxID=2910240 RepID=UPI003D0BEF98